MNSEREREIFNQWVLKHPDNLDITEYEENIMFDAWLASASREGYKLVPVEPTQKMIEAAIIEKQKHGRTDSDLYKAMLGAVE